MDSSDHASKGSILSPEVFVPRPLMLQESGCSERYCFNVSVYSCSGDA